MTTPERDRHQQAKALYLQAIEVPPHDREAWVRARTADPELAAAVLAQLQHATGQGDASPSDRLLGVVRAAAVQALGATPVSQPERIGPYRILGEIGHGGQGVVYRAEQSEPVQRTVAVKVLRSSNPAASVLARFDLERRALAAMSHRGIAKILDAGATPQNEPYVVMELIQGRPLAVFCDDDRLALEERLRLFQEICEAVQHAHNKGIVHRDLKPGNILVVREGDRLVPKILDFGIAKIVAGAELAAVPSLTGGGLVGTLEYMSPEQAGGRGDELDVRSDIYSLGVILYELVAGDLPFATNELHTLGLAAALAAIREREPPRPSARLAQSTDREQVAQRRRTSVAGLGRALAMDLDWIVLQAMAKEPGRRYATATEFAADIGRYLEQLPVLAGPPSAGYRFRKFVRRNRTVLAACAVVTLSLLAGFLGVVREYLRAERLAAEANFQLAERHAARGAWAEAVAAYDAAEQSGYADAFALRLGRVGSLENIDRAAAQASLAAVADVASTSAQNAKLLLLRATLEGDFAAKPAAGMALLEQAVATNALSPADHEYARALLEPDLREAMHHLQHALATAPDHRGALQQMLLLSVLVGTSRDTWAAVRSFGALYPEDPMLPLMSVIALLADDETLNVESLRQAVQSSLRGTLNGPRIMDALERVLTLVAQERAVVTSVAPQGRSPTDLLQALTDLTAVFEACEEKQVSAIVHPSLGRMWPHVKQLIGCLLWGADPRRQLEALDKLLPDPMWSFLRCAYCLQKGKVPEARVAFDAMAERQSFLARLLGSAAWTKLKLRAQQDLVVSEANAVPRGQPVTPERRERTLDWITRVQDDEQPDAFALSLLPDAAWQLGDYTRALEVSYLWVRKQPDNLRAKYRLARALSEVGSYVGARELFRQVAAVDKELDANDFLGQTERMGRRMYAFPELEGLLLADEQRLAAEPANVASLAEVNAALAWLYSAWDQLVPGQGHGEKAAARRRGEKPR